MNGEQGMINALTPAGKPRVAKLVIGQSQTGVTVAGGPFTLTWVVPKSYRKCTGLFYNPADDLSVSLYSENLVSNFVQNFSTATGSAVGMIDPGHNYAEGDIITATVTPNVLSSTPKKITLALRFE